MKEKEEKRCLRCGGEIDPYLDALFCHECNDLNYLDKIAHELRLNEGSTELPSTKRLTNES